jgi:hypothetical protein
VGSVVSLGMSKKFRAAYEAAQAAGMNETESQEFAQDQATRDRMRDIRNKRDADVARLAAFYCGRPVTL